ncbi:hypothetical protein [Hydrogenophaga sp.]|uniref:hypothetical protein n=1 Tax=Hydrogenophaga sp. TaxID=1904254 RepID=UPI00263A34C4|nr:hypothetical protein [Hydrogenophaga sp.]
MTFRPLQSLVRRPLWTAGLTAVCAAAAVATGCGGGGGGGAADSAAVTPTTIIEANIDTLATQVGGGTQDVELYNDGTADWTLYTMANRFAATPIGMSKGAVTEIAMPGAIQHITVVKGYGGQNYALLSMGSKGIGVVNITNPAAMVHVRTMSVSYLPPEYTYSDGGGTIFTEAAAAAPLADGPVTDLLVDDRGTPETTDDELFVANGAFGIQSTKLSHLLGAAADGVLTIDGAQAWTMKYAGENPWGGPMSLQQHGGRLYAALGFLGVGIYDPTTLARQGAYNLYTDCANSQQEDWFGFPHRKPACNTALLANAGYKDADGMPTYEQAAAELGDKNSLGAYPWAEFDRYGKYYYNARSLDLVDLPGGKTWPTWRTRSAAWWPWT